MYEELKERCRACSRGCVYPSECSYFNKPPLRCMRQLLSEAADAIEGLACSAENDLQTGILDTCEMLAELIDKNEKKEETNHV